MPTVNDLTETPATPPAPTAAPQASAPEVAATPARPAAAPVAANDSGDMLPIAGAAGAALLLLGGGIYAATRRRRPDGGPIVAAYETSSDDVVAPHATRAPALAAAMVASPSTHTPSFAAQGASSLPAGFDLSRFGRHTRAAYRGPTPENPFLSLRRRLKRASFLDARERVVSTPVAANPSTPESAPAAAEAPTRHAGLVTTKVRVPPRPGFRPAFQG